MVTFGERLKSLRKEHNLTQHQLAEALELNGKQYISNYEKGTEPDFATVKKIANYFSVSTDYLLVNSEFKTPQHEVIINETKADISIVNTINGLSDNTKIILYETLKSGAMLDFIAALRVYKTSSTGLKPEELAYIRSQLGDNVSIHEVKLKREELMPVIQTQLNKVLDEIDKIEIPFEQDKVEQLNIEDQKY